MCRGGFARNLFRYLPLHTLCALCSYTIVETIWDRLMFTLTIFLLALLLQQVPVSTRSNWTEPVTIFDGDAVSLQWASDSQSFVFFDIGRSPTGYPTVELLTKSWVEYDLSTETLSYSSKWQLQPIVDIQKLSLAVDRVPAVVHQSPDKRYLVFGQESPISEFWSYEAAIGDIQEALVSKTGFLIADPFRVGRSSASFEVLWSEDSSSFVMNSALGDTPFFAHVTGYENNISEYTLTPFELEVEEHRFALLTTEQRVFDISSNGELVLLSAVEQDPDIRLPSGWIPKLIVWNPQEPDQSIIVEDLDVNTVKSAVLVSNEIDET
jgi:hypothetical protein